VLRRLVKTGLAWGLHGSGAGHLVKALGRARRVPLVLGYHRVVRSFAASAPGALPGLIVSRAMLEQQLDWLARRFRLVSLDEVGRAMEGAGHAGPPIAAVTFDDGYADVYENAYPLLRRKGIPAAVFVVTELVGSRRLQIYDRLYLLLSKAFSKGQAPEPLVSLLRETGFAGTLPGNAFAALETLQGSMPQEALLRAAAALETRWPLDGAGLEDLRPMTWEMVREMRRGGLITIGSHTQTHALLTRESPARVQEETAASRRTLEQALGERIDHFAYPGGRFDEAAVAAVRAAGYRFAYTICPHRAPNDPLLTIPRRMLWETSCLDVFDRFSGALMSCQATGVFDSIARCAH
jgi:peptidoglycan/xylan/chitin deacetylase (PgdA/CDA1 family)